MTAPRFWRFNRERYRLSGVRCGSCGETFLAPRLVCPECGGEIGQVVEGIFPRLEPGDHQKQTAGNSIPVTVLVPAYNAAATIRDTLSSLMAQRFGEAYEIIVVDSSSDETPMIVTKEFPSVRLIHRGQQTDPGTARNLGIVQARGKVIACIDADCIASPDWLDRMIAAHRAGHQVVGGSIENGNSESLVAWAGYLGEFREWLPVGPARLVNHVPTCNISYRRSIFTRFGGFPTQFYPQEDLLFHWRLGQHGIPIWFDPDITVQHIHRSTWQAYARHSRRIGRITARVLKLTGDEGVLLARYPGLALLCLPALPLVKWLRTVTVFINRRPLVLRKHAPALFPLLLGLIVWAAGFLEGAWAPPLQVAHREALWETK